MARGRRSSPRASVRMGLSIPGLRRGAPTARATAEGLGRRLAGWLAAGGIAGMRQPGHGRGKRLGRRRVVLGWMARLQLSEELEDAGTALGGVVQAQVQLG